MVIEYLRPDGTPLTWLDLGSGYLHGQGIPLANAMRPLKDEAEPKTSKRGNAYFDFERARLPLPDELETRMRINGIEVDLAPPKKTASGNTFREGATVLPSSEGDFNVTVYLSQSRRWCWLRVRASRDWDDRRVGEEPKKSPEIANQLPLHKSSWMQDVRAGKPQKVEVFPRVVKTTPQTQATSLQQESAHSTFNETQSLLRELIERVERLEQRTRTIEMIILANNSTR